MAAIYPTNTPNHVSTVSLKPAFSEANDWPDINRQVNRIASVREKDIFLCMTDYPR